MSVLAIVAAYLVGAVPVGYLIGRAYGVGDIRRHGSGNIGAANVLRTAGKLPAILTLLGDIAKGYAAVALGASLAGGEPSAAAAGAVAAVAGNCWSVYLGFRGGKGVATGCGAFLELVPWAVLPALPVFLIVAVTTRYVSLASLTSAVCVPLGTLLLGRAFDYPPSFFVATLAMAAIVIARHHENIARLRAGTEPRIGARAAPAGPEAAKSP